MDPARPMISAPRIRAWATRFAGTVPSGHGWRRVRGAPILRPDRDVLLNAQSTDSSVTDTQIIVLGNYATQAVGALLIALTLLALWRSYRRAHLLHLAVSFVCLVVYLCGAAFAMLASSHYAAGHPVRLVTSSISLVAGLAQPAWMILGAAELGWRVGVSRRALVWGNALVALVAMAAVVLTVESTPDARLFVRVGLRALIAGVGFAVAAVVILRARASASRFGRSMTGWSLALYAGAQFLTFVVKLSIVGGGPSFEWSLYSGFFDVSVQIAIGIGLITWHFEEERAASLRASADLRASEERLEQSRRLEVVGRLAGGVAHDFNNVLTAVMGYSDLLRQQLAQHASAHALLDRLDESIGRAGNLTAQLLTFGRKHASQPRELDLVEVIERQEPVLRGMLAPRIRFELAGESGRCTVRADPTEIDQVLLNLVFNARDAMADGGVLKVACVPITLDAASAAERDLALGDYVRWSVTDTGHGMDAETRAHAFEPFFTTKSAGRGTGLGLASVYGIVRQAGGAIEVDSAVGRGTCFTIFLPRIKAPTPSLPAPRPARPTNRRVTILLVDDGSEVRDTLSQALDREGFSVLEARNADTALERLQRADEHIDLLLTDFVLPGMRGDELLAAARARRPGLKAIVMSGHAERASAPEQLDVVWLRKPLAPNELVRAVHETLAAQARAGER